KGLSPIKVAAGAFTWLRAEVTRLLGCCVEDDAKLEENPRSWKKTPEAGRKPPKLDPSALPEESPVEPGPVRGKRQLGAHVFPTEERRDG
uniref:Uncharacterized protein n=1 Tax=Tetraodon nigroviridis TaxID=99883 RepID=H3DR76_TETNG